jgi:hypothetical protein
MLPTLVSFYYQKHLLTLHLAEGEVWWERRKEKGISQKKKLCEKC